MKGLTENNKLGGDTVSMASRKRSRKSKIRGKKVSIFSQINSQLDERSAASQVSKMRAKSPFTRNVSQLSQERKNQGSRKKRVVLMDRNNSASQGSASDIFDSPRKNVSIEIPGSH